MQNQPNEASSLGAQLVVASDVHLRTLDDGRGSLLMDVLTRLTDGVEWLVLNGDIFDFCFGDSAYFRDKYFAFGKLLAEIQCRGTQVVFIEGNHEFHLDRIGWQGISIVQGDHQIVRLKTGESFKIGHGDLITGERLYSAFRATLKSNTVRLLSSRVPGRWLDGYALKHASISRSRDVYRKMNHQRILTAAENWLADGVFHHGIIGHFHTPYFEPRKEKQGYIMSVESWDRPNILTYDNGKFGRIYLETPGEPFVTRSPKSIYSEQ